MDDIGLSLNRKRNDSQTNYSKIFLLLFLLTAISVLMIIGVYSYRNNDLSALITNEVIIDQSIPTPISTVPSTQLTEAVISPSPVSTPIDISKVEVTLNPSYDWKEVTGTEAARLKQNALVWFTSDKQAHEVLVEGTVWRAEFDTTKVNLFTLWPFIQSEESLLEIGWKDEIHIASNRLVPKLVDMPFESASGLLIGSGIDFKLIFWNYLQTQSDAYYEVLISSLTNFNNLESQSTQW